MTAVLVSSACIVLSLFINANATFKMDELENMVVTIIPYSDSATSTVDLPNINNNILFEIESAQNRFRIETVFFTVVISFISRCVTYITVGISLRPLEEFNEKLEEMTVRNLSEKITLNTSIAEIERLGVSFNKMAERINESFLAQKRFSASAAHEMRTPLASIRTRIEVLNKSGNISEQEYKDLLAMIESQTTRLSNVTDVLLQMVELNSIEKKDNIVLEDLLDELVCDLDLAATKKKVRISQKSENISILGNYTLVYRAIYNLIENAIKYNVEGGSIDIEIKKEGNKAAVYITDTCSKIPMEYEDKIFEAFFRVDKSRSRKYGGAGLGLALVKEIAMKHDGDVKLVEKEGEGNIMKLSLGIK